VPPLADQVNDMAVNKVAVSPSNTAASNSSELPLTTAAAAAPSGGGNGGGGGGGMSTTVKTVLAVFPPCFSTVMMAVLPNHRARILSR
jgi:hypothetical protein